MPMDYLHSVEYMHLPLRIVEPHGVECIRVLAAAGLVVARVPPADAPGADAGAELIAITDAGRVALAHYAQGKPFP